MEIHPDILPWLCPQTAFLSVIFHIAVSNGSFPIVVQVWREMGYSSLEDFLIGFWEGFFLDRRDPNNLLNMLWTWQNSNIGLTDGCDGSVEKALGLIRAKAIVMPAAQDLYFPVADEEYEVKFMQNAELRVIPGVWGQFAGAGLNSHDTKFIDKAVCDLLAM